jgi:hypothetical protein
MSKRGTVARVWMAGLTVVGLSACVIHRAGLLVEVTLDMRVPAVIADATLTRVELVACPGTVDPLTHTHDDDAPLAVDLGASESVWITPRVGRYCDLRLQIEGEELASRQAVVPLTCAGARVELSLDEAELGRDLVLFVHAAPPSSAVDVPPQRALEHLLRTLEVDACP